jgi:hypothetical protein
VESPARPHFTKLLRVTSGCYIIVAASAVPTNKRPLNGANAGGFLHVGTGILQGIDTGTLQGIDTGTLQGIDTGTLYTGSEKEEENLVKVLGTQAWLVGSLLLHCWLGCS